MSQLSVLELVGVWCYPHPYGDVGVVEAFRYIAQQLPLAGGKLYFVQHHVDILLDRHRRLGIDLGTGFASQVDKPASAH